jgi:hypothetical protein
MTLWKPSVSLLTRVTCALRVLVDTRDAERLVYYFINPLNPEERGGEQTFLVLACLSDRGAFRRGCGHFYEQRKDGALLRVIRIWRDACEARRAIRT